MHARVFELTIRDVSNVFNEKTVGNKMFTLQ